MSPRVFCAQSVRILVKIQSRLCTFPVISTTCVRNPGTFTTIARLVGNDSSIIGGDFKTMDIARKWKRKFEENSISEPEQSINLILAHVLNCENLCQMDKIMQRTIPEEQVKVIEEMCRKRLSNMPVQYILGEWDFRNLKLSMRPPVFIPRPETEELVEIILDECAPVDFLDLCCGSGPISLSLLQEWPLEVTATAVDQSEIACSLTMENAQKHGLHNRIRVIQSPIHDCLQTITSKFHLITSNPPYIFTEDLADIQPEISFEDIRALDGGHVGFDVIMEILDLCSKILEPEGKLYLEVDPRHPEMLENYLSTNSCLGLYYVKVYRDFCSKLRFVQINKTAR